LLQTGLHVILFLNKPVRHKSQSLCVCPTNFISSLQHSCTQFSALSPSRYFLRAKMEGSPAWQHVLDDADEATASLIIKLQLDDLDALAEGSSHDGSDGEVHDERLARKTQAEELKQYNAVRQLEHEETVLAEASATAASDTAGSLSPPSSPPPATEGPAVVFSCAACGERRGADDCYQVPCQHYYCDDCLAQLFEGATSDESLYPPRCCRQNIPFDEVRLFLPQQIRNTFESKCEELDDNNRKYCRIPTCSAYLGHGHRAGRTGTCPTCSIETCLDCKNPPHAGDCPPDEATQLALNLAQTKGWRRCPSCSRMIELHTGCNHIT